MGESVMIGETVTLSVLDVKGHQVRLGFEAPKDVEDREEVYERIKAERAQAKARRA